MYLRDRQKVEQTTLDQAVKKRLKKIKKVAKKP